MEFESVRVPVKDQAYQLCVLMTSKGLVHAHLDQSLEPGTGVLTFSTDPKNTQVTLSLNDPTFMATPTSGVLLCDPGPGHDKSTC